VKNHTKLQTKALAAARKYGRIIGTMVGTVGFKFRWQNPEVKAPIPHHATIRSLLRRGDLMAKAHSSHPVKKELLITADREDWLEREITEWKPAPPPFRATHQLADKGIWLAVHLENGYWVTRSGKKFPANESTCVRKTPACGR
jgi:hypothetical protein